MYQITEDAGGIEVDKQAVLTGLQAYNYSKLPEAIRDNYQQINLYVRDAEGVIRGGLLSSYRWDYVEVHILWLDDSLRYGGYGSKLLNIIDAKARELNCKLIKLDTFSFQALDFYKKNGFQVYGQIDDVAGGNTHYYLMKRL
ncbi:GNAT family N-acetyltransferase [Paenibacillus sp. SYP-B3998]|uniref:GNAT family N-acetyltransferase n=1 Tax=Paenibacillus sp. SYP-B3998 TaxID=2678564 RepID=A0A6G3ZXX1_9BACL|nr:GNAT family N-acetyltransferase [Paenibacillus sp. SYP-B3998]NEW07066.1 GNAT family N-acetyltransferase [Paenibacillus sp. SYP-B3998]